MDDLISRQDAINFFENMTWYHVNGRGQLVNGANSYTGLYKAKDVYEGLYGIPAADVVPVVRCKNCKHLVNRDETGGKCWRGNGFARAVKNDDFCSYGERKE